MKIHQIIINKIMVLGHKPSNDPPKYVLKWLYILLYICLHIHIYSHHAIHAYLQHIEEIIIPDLKQSINKTWKWDI